MYDKRMFLKIKIKSLAEEARIIRFHEKRVRDDELRGQLHYHRVADVRDEQHATLLAYGFIRGRARVQVDGVQAKPISEAMGKRVIDMVKKYGVPIHNRDAVVREWLGPLPRTTIAPVALTVDAPAFNPAGEGSTPSGRSRFSLSDITRKILSGH